MTKIKKFLDKNQPNNILNYFDPKKGVDTSFTDWYESDDRNAKNSVYAMAYKIIITKPKIQWWVTKQISDFIYSTKRFFERFHK